MTTIVAQNNKEKESVNTSGMQFSNKDGFEPSTFVLGFWNDKVSIKIHPALEKDKQTDNKIYDYEHAVMTSLTVEKLQALSSGIEMYLIPAIINKEDKSVSVIVNNSSLVTIGTGLVLAGKIAPYIAIHKNLAEVTRKPEISIYYEFKSLPLVLDYEAVSGNYETTMDQHTEFKAFISFLKDAVTTLMNGTAHSMRESDRYYRDRVLNDIGSIAAKLGAEVSGKKFTSKPDIFNLKSGGQSRTTPQVSSSDYVETIDSLDNFMN